MIKNQKYYFLFILPLLIIGCISESKESKTYFGGKIINPKSDFVVLHALENVIDSFKIDARGKFIGELSNVKEGLYYFSHGNENQHIYLEPNDSLMLRLNTWDFDESLVFAGKGAERNNILIDGFLEREQDKKLFYRLNKLNSKIFKAKVDSILALKMQTYNEYAKNHSNETNGYKEILKVALTYPVYAQLEKYPMMHAKYNSDSKFQELNNDFYNYRKLTKINNDSLMYYPPYTQYIRNYLYNETYSLGHSPMKKTYSTDFTTDLLQTINDKIISNETKNAFLKQTVINHFYNKSTCKIEQKTFDKFFELSTSEKDIDLITKLVKDAKAIKSKEQLIDFNITDFLNTKHSIKKVIKNKNTFILFWNPEYVSEPYIASRIKFFRSQYKNINFIQINMVSNKPERIQNLDIKTQYYLDSDSNAHDFLSSKMPRSILVNKYGTVLNGYGSISSYNLIPYLEELNK